MDDGQVVQNVNFEPFLDSFSKAIIAGNRVAIFGCKKSDRGLIVCDIKTGEIIFSWKRDIEKDQKFQIGIFFLTKDRLYVMTNSIVTVVSFWI